MLTELQASASLHPLLPVIMCTCFSIHMYKHVRAHTDVYEDLFASVHEHRAATSNAEGPGKQTFQRLRSQMLPKPTLGSIEKPESSQVYYSAELQ